MGTITAIARLTFRMSVQLFSLRRARAAALGGFRRSLQEAGLPEATVRQLAAAYPDIGIGDLLGQKSGEPPAE
ncbi:MAG: hypothetical protein ACOX18_04485 [Bacillota bacterium]